MFFLVNISNDKTSIRAGLSKYHIVNLILVDRFVIWIFYVSIFVPVLLVFLLYFWI